jgi:ferrous iron transport protein A
MGNLCMQKQLASLKEGQVASVIGLLAKGGMRRRLMDLGVIAGTSIKCIQKSPSGDPTAYEIRGAIIALRMEDANDILVRLVT